MDQFVLVHSRSEHTPRQLSFHINLDSARGAAERWWAENKVDNDTGDFLTIFHTHGIGSAIAGYRGHWEGGTNATPMSSRTVGFDAPVMAGRINGCVRQRLEVQEEG